RLSLLGWNVMPTARNARGVDIIAYDGTGTRFIGVQVKALSTRNPVPLGTDLEKIMGDFWVIVNNLSQKPAAFIMLPSEVKERAHRGEKDGRISFWLQPGAYDQVSFREVGNASVMGTLSPNHAFNRTRRYGPSTWPT